MCGIAGYLGPESPEHLASVLSVMLSRLRRRGPDGEGTELWAGAGGRFQAGLAHRRLAIIDLSEAGHQPMVSDDREIGVVFNGCIFNFLDLRRELESDGYRFRSHCDTEVLLQGYRAWGAAALARRSQGMFAFAIWDNPRQLLTLVRDRLGVKPLYFATSAGTGSERIAFASTADALREAGLAGPIDTSSVAEFLEFGFVTDSRCIYEGVGKVQPGTVVTWHHGRLETETYWEAPAAAEVAKVSFDDAVEQTEALLLDAVKGRLIADVPIGALLSGGIDSALVCWAISKLNANIRAFTVSTPGDAADETQAASETARILGASHEVVELPRQEQFQLDELIDAFSEPFACSSALGMLRVSRAVRNYATVLLTGDGGDDFFLGYPYHKHMALAQRLAGVLPGFAPALWRSGVRPLVNGFGPLRRPKHLIDYATGGLGAVTRVRDGLPFYETHGLLGPRLEGATVEQRQIALSFESGRHVLDDLVRYDLRTVFAGEYLPKVDGTTMYCGLEARSPFLDYRLAELALKLPDGVRLYRGQLKAVLRELARRKMGSEVAGREKRGFTIPIEKWLAERGERELKSLDGSAALCRQGWIEPGALARCVEEALAAQSVPRQLWYLLVLNAWLEKNA
jgi:asparagine synthase (glutamine-hydrolysing)